MKMQSDITHPSAICLSHKKNPHGLTAATNLGLGGGGQDCDSNLNALILHIVNLAHIVGVTIVRR